MLKKPVTIDARYPTEEDIAEIFHIGKARMRKLNAFAREILETSPNPPSKTVPVASARTKKRSVQSVARRKRQAAKQA